MIKHPEIYNEHTISKFVAGVNSYKHEFVTHGNTITLYHEFICGKL